MEASIKGVIMPASSIDPDRQLDLIKWYQP